MTRRISRRTMLQTSAAAGAGFWLGTAAAAQNEDDKEEHAAAEKAAAAVFEAYSAGDMKKLTGHFAEKVKFMGEPRIVFDSPPEPGLVGKPIDVETAKLVDGYAKVVEKVGKEKWSVMLKKCIPTLERATAKDMPIPTVEVGDFVYDLHFREATKGKRRGYDEAIIFVLRKVDGKFVVVGHFADL
ncbi:MAG: hypothetical protein WD875_11310 [Pirellulales bacterium]